MDAVALEARLQSLLSNPAAEPSRRRSVPPSLPSSWSPTPPPDLEAEAKRIDLLEEESRNLLEQDGCPPCYPSDPSFSMRNPSEEYKGIISYWLDSSSSRCPLNGQWEDWCQFRRYQEKNRRYYAQRFAQFSELFRERRRRHNLPEDVCPRFNFKEQTRQENWVEFQDWHLRRAEEFEKNAETESKNLHSATEKLQALEKSQGLADPEQLDYAKHLQNVYIYKEWLVNDNMGLHKNLMLPWIEQERIKMRVNDESAIVDDINVIPNTPTRSTRNRKLRVPSVLDSARSAISKRDSRKRNLRSQRPGRSMRPEESTFDVRTSESSITQMRNLLREGPQGTRENASVRALHPQKVTKSVKRDSKSKQQAHIDASPRLLPPSRKVDQRMLKPRERPSRSRFMYEDPTEDLVTKSGRVSRRPKRPGFVSR